ncbi:MAG: DUF6471 domain-containing protein [Pseudomonadales bacterium]|jgi:hypothetical protein|nr:DUF6471 domain-containing protein [Pseudomonadales bacterium]MDP6470115.1 DUF6471 domain-containing protein [Pseudomonadales bacterium]MDP6827018.1 DUF6471 domain-containing protein [Pseudomonadales bacterium]|tara:strand:+ start:409 stop:681 length:273 start_codon:yes stop_codon:yes gene_type:complete
MREAIRRWLRGRMAYKGMEYKDLCARLAELGVTQNESNLRSRANNGSLGAQMFVYLLLAMDIRALDLGEIREILSDIGAGDAVGGDTESG